MRDNEIREAARVFRGMTLEEAERFATMLTEPEQMRHKEVCNQIDAAVTNLIDEHNVGMGLAEFAGDILKHGASGAQNQDTMIDSIIAFKRTVRQGMMAKLIVRTYPVDGARWFASISTWREGDR